MSLDRLRVFKTIYECGNTASAADLLNVSRPAVSQSLSKLEKQLGVALFTRMAKGLVPTPLGHRLAATIAPMLERIETEMNFVSQELKGSGGVLNVGAPQTTGTIHMPRIVERFCGVSPNVEIHLMLSESSKILRSLMDGQLDMAILDLYGGIKLEKNLHTFCHVETLIEETVSLTCSPRYFEQRIQDDLSFENLAGLDFLVMQPDCLEVRNWFLNQFDKSPQRFNKRVVTDNGVALLDCALNHMGVVLHGSNITHHYVAKGELVEICPRVRGENNQISLVRLLDKKPSPLETKFVKSLKAYAAGTWRELEAGFPMASSV